MASPANGYAQAVQPIAPNTIHTDTEGLIAEDIQIPTSDGAIYGYYAAPEGGQSLPTIVVIHEIFSVHEHIKDVARRLAKLGYLAIAPDFFGRQGDVSQLADHQQIFTEVVSKVPDAQVLSDIDAAFDWATQSGLADPARLAVTGFCWGGRLTWLYAAHTDRIQAGVAWYGRLASKTDPLHPQQPIDVAAHLKAPVLGLYGGQDAGIPQDQVSAVQEILKDAGGPSRIHVYPEAGHAFYADYRPSYKPIEAEDGFTSLRDWLRTYGVS
ncbi:carboxymethylenebutenolidase [Capsulimonas corticalis]|uniref:Carboxymethylenebutenolidase n=1 Tax=Capsulimonas corticalis TaxID=2219043 RepID=A0A402D439_9BACT|nr:dienelactone hydrolase family protein [Capsulimonas corticalis]BDI29652.1 carboxymethylenebutenolidase [Capsulimonas corticalis]